MRFLNNQRELNKLFAKYEPNLFSLFLFVFLITELIDW